ncbi:unnamed protein product [Rhodiola kirilowii]
MRYTITTIHIPFLSAQIFHGVTALCASLQMTVNCMNGCTSNKLMESYGFSMSVNQNPWDVIQFSGNARIHLESFLSIFNISGLPEEYYYNTCRLSGGGGGSFVDGAVLAAARTIPAWSDKDLPPIPSQEQSAVKELQGQCQQMLAEYPTTSEQDQEILETMPESGRSFEAAIK